MRLIYNRYIILLFLFSLFALTNQSLGQTWEQTEINTSESLREVYFTSSQNGWLVGDNGEILKTTNQGASWESQNSGTANTIWSVHFNDNNTGWASGNDGTILKTTDGGDNWTSLSSGTTERLTSIYFVDDNTGWAVGSNGIILNTTDGGTNWNVQENFGDGSYFFQSVYATSSNEAWAVANNDRIYYTSDGGSSWTEQSYTSAGTGWKSVHFIDNTTGIVVGEGGAINRTTDGGSTWSSISSGVSDELESVYFSDSSNGIIVGRNGTILTTTDGGVNWSQQSSPTTESLYEVIAIHPDTAWASGANGTFLTNFSLPDVEPPTAPTGLAATAGNGQIDLSWDANSEEDLEGYNIYRATSTGVDTTSNNINNSLITDSQFTDGSVTNGTTYYYVITAVDSSGNQSATSSEVSATPEEPSTLFSEFTSGITSLKQGDISFADFDNDGDLDVAVTGINDGQRYSEIYRNDSQSFVDIVAGVTPVDKSAIAWGDYDRDGDLDLAIMGDNGSTSITKIYENTDSGFSELGTSIVGVNSGDITWVDFDNDGDLDLALTGLSDGTPVSRIYENNNGSFSDANANLKGLYNSSMAWADFDGDGDMDVAISGNDGSVRTSIIYENEGGTLTNIEASLTGIESGDIQWEDIDTDGDLDLIVTGYDGQSAVTEIYENNNNEFLDYQADLTGLQNSSLAVGDIDNNGQSDLVIVGTNDSGQPKTKAYLNNDGVLSDTTLSALDVASGDVALADFTNDDMLDLAFIGEDESGGPNTVFYSNNINESNSAPAELASLNASVIKEDVTLSWAQGTDTETPTEGLTYNVRVGTSSGAHDIINPHADLSSGYLRTTENGNASQSPRINLKNLQPGTYYWSVQAIDATQKGGSFATEQTFTVTEAFTNINASIDSLANADVTWGDYDNDGDLDLAVAGENNNGAAVTKIYQNNSGSFSAIGAGLEAVSNSSVAWGDYDNDGDLDLAVSGINDSGTRTAAIYENKNGTFTNISANITGVSDGSIDWGDFDNDGDLDLLISGQTGSSSGITNVYVNESGSFSAINLPISEYYGTVTWVDYDNDQDLDIAFSGIDDTGTRKSEIYENSPEGFKAIGADLINVNHSSMDWGDYDNDGDLDLVLTGENSSGDTESYIYENTSNGFRESDIGILAVQDGSVAWGDYDNDGDLDLSISGNDGSFLRNWVYENTSQGFEKFTVGLNGLDHSTTAWGDFDNDGDLDLAVYGEKNDGVRIGTVFENNISKSNSSPNTITNTSSNVIKESVTLEWDQTSDTETPSDGLTYNLRIGTTPGGGQIVSSQADSTNGFYRLADFGNVQSNNSWSVDSLDKGKYYWSVQAVDGGYKGGDFAVEDSFTVEDRFVDTQSIFTALENSDIAWGDYDDDGDLDFIITGQDDSGDPRTILYQNNDGSFSSVNTSITDLESGSVDWKDIDGDGDLDLFITGRNASGAPLSKMYENRSSGFAEIYAGVFAGVYNSDVAWGDYNNDGREDLIMIGNDGSNSVTKLYQNTTNGFMEDTSHSIEPTEKGEVAWVDVDQDGDLDLAIVGEGAGASIYENNDGNFDLFSSLVGVSDASMAWGDLGSDGDLDVVYSGLNSSGNEVTNIYEFDNGSFNAVTSLSIQDLTNGSAQWADYDNDGDDDLLVSGTAGTNNFTLVYDQVNGDLVESPIKLDSVSNGVATWGDYNGDNTLDMLTAGATSSGLVTKLYRNNLSIANNDPEPPTNLASSVNNTNVSLQWETGSDSETPDSSLTYNVRVGTAPGEDDIMSVDASLSNGELKTLSRGNVGLSRNWSIKDLSDGTYYWSVQAIDGSYSGSEFAEEQTFTIDANFVESSESLQGLNYSDIAWGDYDNDGDLDIAVMGYTGDSYVTYIYENESGSFNTIDAGIEGLYRGALAWGDYDNDDDLDLVVTGQNSNGDLVSEIYENQDGSFSAIDAGLEPVEYSSISWGDYDNDGDLDLAISGRNADLESSTTIYENEGGNFTALDTNIENLEGSLAWGDYDNDGDLDLVTSGYNGSSSVTTIYENEGSNFTEIEADLEGVQNSSVAWGDYDNDGDLDLVVAGTNGDLESSLSVYENENGDFTALNTDIENFENGSVKWGDYDNDGDLDLVITGSNDSGNITKVYENENGSFTDIEANLEGTFDGSLDWGDYDNDGDLDLITTGSYSTKIYNNRTITKQPFVENSLPSSPQNTNANVSEGNVTLVWDQATDSETPQQALSYNVQIGSVMDQSDITSPEANITNGFRKTVKLGNSQLNDSYHIDNLPTGTYYWRVQAVDGAFDGGSFSAVDSFRIATLDPPKLLTAQPTETALTLEWEPVESDELSNYYVYRSTSSIDSLADFNKSSLMPVDTLDGTTSSFDDELVDEGSRYYYRITAVDSNEVESSFSRQASVVAGSPLPPQNIVTTPGDSSVTVQWDPNTESDLKEYYIYRDTDSIPLSALDTINPVDTVAIPDTSLQDSMLTNGETYFYRVTAVDDSEIESKFSEEVFATPRDMSPPVPPQNIITTEGDGIVELEWDVNNEADMSLYRVYSDTVAIDSVDTPDPEQLVGTIEHPDTTFTHTSLKGGKQYYYRLAAVDTTDKSSGFSSEVVATPQLQQPSPPSNVIAKEEDKQLKIVWNQNPELDITSYRIYRSQSQVDSSLTIDTLATVQYPDTVFIDRDVETGNRYYYRVTAYDNSELESGSSRQVNGVPQLIPPVPPLAKNIDAGETKVELQWKPNTEMDLDSYEIYRSTSSIDSLADPDTLTLLDPVASSTDSTYIDSSVVVDQQYFYRLVAVDTDGLKSGFSNQLTATTTNLPPDPPKDFIAEAGNVNINLSWSSNTEEDLGYYKIYRNTAPIDSLNDINNLAPIDSVSSSETSYTDKSVSSGNTYYYRITARDDSYLESGFSRQAQIVSQEIFISLDHNLPHVTSSDIAWGDYDNDGDMDIAIMGETSSQRITRIYENTSNGFIDSGVSLTGLKDGDIAWADYDSDGDLDLAITGYDGSSGITEIYENTSNGFVKIESDVIDAYDSAIDWGDYDNDGDLDLVISGWGGTGGITRIYRNDSGEFTDIEAGLQGVDYSSVEWGDYDSDGDLDLALSGITDGGQRITKIYENSDGSFSEIDAGLEGVSEGALAWIDYDNDNDLDLLVTGTNGTEPKTLLYENDAGNFTETPTDIVDVYLSSLSWHDYNNDGQLDIFITGRDGSANPVSKIYTNENGIFSDVGASFDGVSDGVVAVGYYNDDTKLDFIFSGSDSESNPTTQFYQNQIAVSTKSTSYQIAKVEPQPSEGLLSGADRSNFKITFEEPLNPRSLSTGAINVSGTSSEGFIPFNYALEDSNRVLTLTADQNFYATEDVTIKLNSGASGLRSMSGQYFDGDSDGIFDRSTDNSTSYQYSVAALADYNKDGEVNFDDLTEFRSVWTSKNYDKELGPTTGDFPALKVQPDSRFNIDDLLTFIRYWNHNLSSQDKVASAGQKKKAPSNDSKLDTEDFTNDELDINNGGQHFSTDLSQKHANSVRHTLNNRLKASKRENQSKKALKELKTSSNSDLEYLDLVLQESGDKYQEQQKASKNKLEYDVEVNYEDSLSAMKFIVDYDPQKLSLNKIVNKKLFNSLENGRTVFISHIDSLEGIAIINAANFGQLGKVKDKTLASLSFEKKSTDTGKLSVGYDIRNKENDSEKALSDINIDASDEIPEQFVLEDNYPNPFNPSTLIQYQIPSESNIRLRIYDILGRKVATLLDEQVDAGYYRVRWNAASNYASGVYFYVLDAKTTDGSEFRKVKKMLLIK